MLLILFEKLFLAVAPALILVAVLIASSQYAMHAILPYEKMVISEYTALKESLPNE